MKAKELLNLEPGKPERIENLEEDMVNLHEVWSELHKIWQIVEEPKDQTVAQVPIKKLETSISEARQKINELPAKFSTYAPVDAMKEKLKVFNKINNL